MNKLTYCLLTGMIMGYLFTGCSVSGRKTVENLSDLEGMRIAVPRGTTHEKYISLHTKADMKSYDGTAEALEALHLGRVDAAVTNQAVASVVIRYDSTLFLSSLEMGKDPVAIAIAKGKSGLKDSVDAIIRTLRSEGILADMENRWLGSSGEYHPVSFPVPTMGVPLRVAVSAGREPFSFKDISGQICGFDAELAYRIAAGLNRPVQFQEMQFPSLITSLQTGKADVIISLINVTSERARIVDFSIPYFESARVLLLKK